MKNWKKIFRKFTIGSLMITMVIVAGVFITGNLRTASGKTWLKRAQFLAYTATGAMAMVIVGSYKSIRAQRNIEKFIEQTGFHPN